MVEVGAVIDAGLLRWAAAEDLWLPGVEMRVKVKDGDWTVRTGYAAEKGKGDGVVTAERDQTRQCFALR